GSTVPSLQEQANQVASALQGLATDPVALVSGQASDELRDKVAEFFVPGSKVSPDVKSWAPDGPNKGTMVVTVEPPDQEPQEITIVVIIEDSDWKISDIVPEEPPASPSDPPLTDPKELYEEVFSQYRIAIANDFYRDDFDGDHVTGTFLAGELLMASGYDDPSEFCVYFAYFDIDDNGVPELLIGAENPGLQGLIVKYDLFSWADGEVYRPLGDDYLGDRTHFTIHDGGVIAVSASGGWQTHGWSFYTISEDGRSSVLLDYVHEEGTEHSRGLDWEEVISEEEFLAIVRNHTGQDPWELTDDFTFDWTELTAVG
ncbi:MAG: hypothetical protein FWD29_09790, partial [Micrococcales bacterium]|nr:hypothetical protein [Micrococcales bacterium]